LSTADVLRVFGVPIHVLPIIMGGAMFVQQRMSGATADPTQRQLMFLMPIMFTIMFYNFSSGLVLYWLVNSLMTMAIQYALLRTQNNQPKALEVVQ
jgi:YidC/Oxa1 family membrane protein insertase